MDWGVSLPANCDLIFAAPDLILSGRLVAAPAAPATPTPIPKFPNQLFEEADGNSF